MRRSMAGSSSNPGCCWVLQHSSPSNKRIHPARLPRHSPPGAVRLLAAATKPKLSCPAPPPSHPSAQALLSWPAPPPGRPSAQPHLHRVPQRRLLPNLSQEAQAVLVQRDALHLDGLSGRGGHSGVSTAARVSAGRHRGGITPFEPLAAPRPQSALQARSWLPRPATWVANVRKLERRRRHGPRHDPPGLGWPISAPSPLECKAAGGAKNGKHG
jgi:hypothetical protein